MCDRVLVMYLGRGVEESDSEDLYTHPLHPYTQALLASCLPDDPDAAQSQPALEGDVASPLDPPGGCHFHPRCPHVMPACRETPPLLKEMTPGHWVACHLYQENGG